METNGSATTTYTYAGTNYANPHAPTGIGGVTYSYDNNGNLTGDGTWSYVWDYRNRLTEADNGSAATYAYDHTEQRVLKVVGNATTTYPSKYFSQQGATTTAYIYLPNGELIATVEGNGTATSTSYIHPDHLGSTNVVTNAIGTVAQTLDYYPFGDTRIDSGSDVSSREYIGEHFDEETDLSYLNARYYEGSRGQFLSQDPLFLGIGSGDLRSGSGKLGSMLSDPQRLNSYSYAGGNPITNKDPGGEDYYHFDNGNTVQRAPFNRNNNYYQKMDTALLQTNLATAESNRGNLGLFYTLVNSGSYWDYKTSSVLGNPDQRRYYFYDGKLVTAEEFGNIHYGETGTAFGFGPTILTDAAGANHILKTGNQNTGPVLSNYRGNFDDPIDTGNIRLGIMNYNNANRPNSSTSYANASNAAYQGSGAAGLVRGLSTLVAGLQSLVKSLSGN